MERLWTFYILRTISYNGEEQWRAFCSDNADLFTNANNIDELIRDRYIDYSWYTTRGAIEDAIERTKASYKSAKFQIQIIDLARPFPKAPKV